MVVTVYANVRYLLSTVYYPRVNGGEILSLLLVTLFVQRTRQMAPWGNIALVFTDQLVSFCLFHILDLI